MSAGKARAAREEASLEQALESFVTSVETPDAAALEAMIARFPRYAGELTDFAVEWALEDGLPAAGGKTAGSKTEGVEKLVAAAMSRFDRHLAPAAEATSRASTAGAPPSPFAGRSPAELRRLAEDVGIDITIVAKLKDRMIDAATVPARLYRALENALATPRAAIETFLAGPPRIAAGTSFKAAEAPRAAREESFEEAVRRSTLPEKARRRLLEPES